MRDFLAAAGYGVVIVVIAVLYCVTGLCCLLMPAYLAGEVGVQWLWLYAGSLPLLGFISGGMVYLLDWIYD